MNTPALIRLTTALARVSRIKQFKWVGEKFTVCSAVLFGSPDNLKLEISLGLADASEPPACDCRGCQERKEKSITTASSGFTLAILASGSHRNCVIDSSFYSDKDKTFTIKIRHTKSGRSATGTGDTMYKSCLCASSALIAETEDKL